MFKSLVSPILIIIFWTSTTSALTNQTSPRRQLSQCGVGCLECDDNGCSYCFYGYYLQLLDDLHVCQECPDECEEACEDFAGCTQCMAGYYPAYDGELCEPCNSSCVSCQSETYCTVCQDHYNLINGTCIQMKNANILSYSLGLALFITFLILS